MNHLLKFSMCLSLIKYSNCLICITGSDRNGFKNTSCPNAKTCVTTSFSFIERNKIKSASNVRRCYENLCKNFDINSKKIQNNWLNEEIGKLRDVTILDSSYHCCLSDICNVRYVSLPSVEDNDNTFEKKSKLEKYSFKDYRPLANDLKNESSKKATAAKLLISIILFIIF